VAPTQQAEAPSRVASVATQTIADQDSSAPTPRRWTEAEILVLLAGRCAEARARQSDRAGWCRPPDRFESVCIHEAGHTVMIVSVGRVQNGIIVEAAGQSLRGVAESWHVAPPPGTPDHPTFEGFGKLGSDFEQATVLAKLVAGSHGWLMYLRSLWLRADAILGDHWLAVTMLAQEAREKRIVRRERAQEICERWMPVKAPSLSAFLGRPQQTAM